MERPARHGGSNWLRGFNPW